MIEEAIFGLPARVEEPERGEFDAWERRLSLVPKLASNGMGLMSRPGPAHLEYSVGILDGLISNIPALETASEKRWGRTAQSLSDAVEAVEEMRSRLERMLQGRATGRVIMGREELTMILDYSEHIDLDTEELARDAEKIIRRLARQSAGSEAASSGGGISPPSPDSLLVRIGRAAGTGTTLGRRGATTPLIRYNPLYTPMEIPVDPFLTVPVVPLQPVRAVFKGGTHEGRCRSSIIAPEGVVEDTGRTVYDVLMSALVANGPMGALCGGGDLTRWILAPDTWHLGWRDIVSSEIPGMIPELRFTAAAEISRRKRLALARMVVAFRLHSGVYTTEAAADFLEEAVGMSRSEARREAVTASISAAASFEGVAIMTADGIVRSVTMEGASRNPRRSSAELLEENAGLPLSLIAEIAGQKD